MSEVGTGSCCSRRVINTALSRRLLWPKIVLGLISHICHPRSTPQHTAPVLQPPFPVPSRCIYRVLSSLLCQPWAKLGLFPSGCPCSPAGYWVWGVGPERSLVFSNASLSSSVPCFGKVAVAASPPMMHTGTPGAWLAPGLARSPPGTDAARGHTPWHGGCRGAQTPVGAEHPWDDALLQPRGAVAG